MSTFSFVLIILAVGAVAGIIFLWLIFSMTDYKINGPEQLLEQQKNINDTDFPTDG